MGSRSFDVSGFNVRVHGLDEACGEVLDDAWGLFAGDGGRPVIEVGVRFEGPELAEGRIDDAPLGREIDGERIAFEAREGRIDAADDGRCVAVVGPGHPATRAFALINLILPVLAWRLPAMGGLIVHSGAVLVEERGFLLVGQAGAGKSTFVNQAIRGGALAVSEDLNLVVLDDDGWWLAGSPFRTRIHRGPGPGRWPLAAVLIPSHGPNPSLDSVPQILVSAQLQANLPYVADCWMQVAGGAALTERLDDVPSGRLTFAPDPSFVGLLRGWPDSLSGVGDRP